MNDLYYLGVKAVIRNTEGEILLLKAKDYWDLPGGRTQLGESENEALIRELSEETGLQVTAGRHLGMYVSQVRLRADGRESAGLIFSVYECLASGAAVTISHEHIGYQWTAPAEVSERLADKFGSQISAMLSQ